ncbi:hypothetical protein FRB94_002521 [Tulasnella sp. JGI-2019a]|nr:hypothetical protein FRB93_010169 [Tulasnella sp. JGI-2019a]KAG9013447.1 hypothetical protein FRB94_002521 [Tulasnella sp. JGI-2019a]
MATELSGCAVQCCLRPPRRSRFSLNAAPDDPDNFVHHIHRLTGGVIQTITYGNCFDGETDLVKTFVPEERGWTLSNLSKIPSGVVSGYANSRRTPRVSKRLSI